MLLYAVFCAPRPFFLEDIVCSFGVIRILGWEIHISHEISREISKTWQVEWHSMEIGTNANHLPAWS